MREGRGRRVLRWGLAALYAGIGVVHLVAADAMLPLMPGIVPFPRLVILATGLCEIAGAAGLLTRRWRGAAAVGLALYAVCVYPANLKHALEHVQVAGIPDSWWYHGPRLAFQPVFVWAALWAGGLIDWPFRRHTPLRSGCREGEPSRRSRAEPWRSSGRCPETPPKG